MSYEELGVGVDLQHEIIANQVIIDFFISLLYFGTVNKASKRLDLMFPRTVKAYANNVELGFTHMVRSFSFLVFFLPHSLLVLMLGCRWKCLSQLWPSLGGHQQYSFNWDNGKLESKSWVEKEVGWNSRSDLSIAFLVDSIKSNIFKITRTRWNSTGKPFPSLFSNCFQLNWYDLIWLGN